MQLLHVALKTNQTFYYDGIDRTCGVKAWSFHSMTGQLHGQIRQQVSLPTNVVDLTCYQRAAANCSERSSWDWQLYSIMIIMCAIIWAVFNQVLRCQRAWVTQKSVPFTTRTPPVGQSRYTQPHTERFLRDNLWLTFFDRHMQQKKRNGVEKPPMTSRDLSVACLTLISIQPCANHHSRLCLWSN